MPTRRRDNDEERFARIDALMEEYRVNHEDLQAYVRQVQAAAAERRRESQEILDEAREQFRRAQGGKRR